MGHNMGNLLGGLGINILSSFAFAAISAWIIYSRGQTFFESVSYGVIICLIIFASLYLLFLRNNKIDDKGAIDTKKDESQKVNANIISNSPITKVGNITLNKK
jgi:hypothetical protein